MFNSQAGKLTPLAYAFLEPHNSVHRQYEALRAYFVEGLASADTAARWGYTSGSFRVLCHQFRQNPERQFFRSAVEGPRCRPKADPLKVEIIALRKQNCSIYDIARALAERGHHLSPAGISLLLKAEGFARLPRRADEERPAHPGPE